MAMNYGLDDLQDQGDRIAQLLREASQPQQPSLGDSAAAPFAIDRAALGNLAGAPYQDPQEAYLKALKGPGLEKQEQLGQQAQAQGQIYKIMKEQKEAGDAEATAYFDKAVQIVGDDPVNIDKLLSSLHQEEEQTGEELTPANFMTKAVTTANRLGLKNQKRELDRQLLEARIATEGAQADSYNALAEDRRRPGSGSSSGGGGSRGTEFERLLTEYQDPATDPARREMIGVYLNRKSGGLGAGLTPLEKKQQEALGKNSGEIAADLPNIIANADTTIMQVDNMLADPGLSTVVGAKGLTGGLVAGQIIPGTDAANFKTRLDQLKGGQFLQAYQQLKGGGAISEVEGAKAESAIARMDTAQTEKAFRQAAEEYKEIIRKGVERAKEKAATVSTNPILDLYGESLPSDRLTAPVVEDPLGIR